MIVITIVQLRETRFIDHSGAELYVIHVRNEIFDLHKPKFYLGRNPSGCGSMKSASNLSRFFSSVDGLLIYHKQVSGEVVMYIKGKPHYAGRFVREPGFVQQRLIIGIYMAKYELHVSRTPYGGVIKFLPVTFLNQPSRKEHHVRRVWRTGEARFLIVYYHHTRRAGGHHAEIVALGRPLEERRFCNGRCTR